MRFINLLLIFLISSFAFATTIIDVEGYILEGGKAVKTHFSFEELNPGVEYNISAEYDPSPDDEQRTQRALSEQHYKAPQLSNGAQEIFKESFSRLFRADLTNRSMEQDREVQSRMQNARNADEASRNVEHLLAQLREFRESEETRLQDAYSKLDESRAIMSELKRIKQSDYPMVKKNAHINILRIKSDRTEYKGKNADKFNFVREKYSKVSEDDFKTDEQHTFLDMGATSYLLAKESYVNGDEESSDNLIEKSNTFLDIALGSTPFVGFFKDAYEAYSGKNLLTGEALSDTDRTFAVIGLGIGVVSGGTLGGAVKAIPRLLPFAKRFAKIGVEIFEAAGKLGLKAKDKIVDFANVTINILGNEVGTIGKLEGVTNSLKQGKGLYSKSGKLISKETLNQNELKNLKRFENKIPAGANKIEIIDAGTNGKIFSAEVSGNVPGSKAIYEKHIDYLGKTKYYFKTTYDNKGYIVHIKDKIKGNVITPGDL